MNPHVLLLLLAGCSDPPPVQPAPEPQPVVDARPGERPPPPHRRLPSSLVDPQDRKVAANADDIILRAERRGEPLYNSFAKRSRSPVVAEALELEAADVLADVGSGTGGFELFLLEERLPFALIWAVDVDHEALAWMSGLLERTELEGRERVLTLHSTEGDVGLPTQSVDKVLLLNTPFFLSFDGGPNISPTALRCLQTMVDALKPGGMLVIAERHLDADEENVRLDDDPTVRCAPLVDPFVELGLTLRDRRMVQLDDPNTGAHCIVRLDKPADMPLILGERTVEQPGLEPRGRPQDQPEG
jgi:SAM-dependent methyltransferase